MREQSKSIFQFSQSLNIKCVEFYVICNINKRPDISGQLNEFKVSFFTEHILSICILDTNNLII